MTEERITDLEETVEANEEKLVDLAPLQAEIDEAKAREEELKAEVSQMRSTIETLRSDVNDANGKIDTVIRDEVVDIGDPYEGMGNDITTNPLPQKIGGDGVHVDMAGETMTLRADYDDDIWYLGDCEDSVPAVMVGLGVAVERDRGSNLIWQDGALFWFYDVQVMKDGKIFSIHKDCVKLVFTAEPCVELVNPEA